MDQPIDDILCAEELNKAIYSLFNQIVKLKQILETGEAAQKRYITKQAIKKELYKKTMKLTEEQFKELSNNILSANRRNIDILSSQLGEFGQNCWDCDFSMCYKCNAILERAAGTLLEIINKN